MNAQRELLEEFGRDLEGVRLTDGNGGVFEVYVDGNLVYDKAEDDSGFDLDAISAEVKDRIAAEV